MTGWVDMIAWLVFCNKMRKRVRENWKVFSVLESDPHKTAAEYLFGCKIMNLPG